MATAIDMKTREYGSGEIVEPGEYMDVETGALVHVCERDELPDGNRIVRYRRRFRRLDNPPATSGRAENPAA